jgi:hypothetical protein
MIRPIAPCRPWRSSPGTEKKGKGRGRGVGMGTVQGGSALPLVTTTSVRASLFDWLLREVEEKKEKREKRKQEGKEKQRKEEKMGKKFKHGNFQKEK